MDLGSRGIVLHVFIYLHVYREHKGADQLSSYCPTCLCFCIYVQEGSFLMTRLMCVLFFSKKK